MDLNKLPENPNALTFVLTFAIIGILLWRNYDVIKAGAVINPSLNKNAEQKELSKGIKQVGIIEEGQIISNTYGTYEFKNNQWVKTKEVWNLFTQSI